ncbi:MAG TPA: histidinol-phosphate transaminase [Victivallales bacterium]|nr:histidinol-phosphate transaminase [Victivallales bacterium]
MKSFFRKDILEMSGYVPGEQPKEKGIVKLNTNENPFPPSRKIKKYLSTLDIGILRLYPNPESCELRKIIADKFAVKESNVIVGNGSDDILNMIVRCCTDKKKTMAYFDPSYSLYPVLAEIQGTECVKISLEKDFSIPTEIPRKGLDSSLFMITRPNAPTSNSFPKKRIREICSKSKGIVLVDEAYADFAEDDCIDLLGKYKNLVICRTLSKSYSLAGIRLGFAIASEEIISQMMKVKDSYNVNRISQEIAKIAILDNENFERNINLIKSNRKFLIDSLRKKGFKVIDSQTNFVFAAPPGKSGKNAKETYLHLKKNRVLVRYFPGKTTGKYLRITVGTKLELDKLISLI